MSTEPATSPPDGFRRMGELAHLEGITGLFRGNERLRIVVTDDGDVKGAALVDLTPDDVRDLATWLIEAANYLDSEAVDHLAPDAEDASH